MKRAGSLLLTLFAVCALVAAFWFGPLTQARNQHPGDAPLVLDATLDHVIDGDSIAVKLDSGPIEVRLHGVDAPEWKQPFGREAKAKLKRTLRQGQAVELMPVDQDRYDRMVAVVYLAGTNINEALIADGFAWAYRNYLGELKDDAHYCDLEATARVMHRGLWSQAPKLWVPPWIYRERQRAGTGAKVPSPDYSKETAAACMAALGGATPAALAQGSLSRPPPEPDCVIKGNINGRGEKIYHLPGGRDYEATRVNPQGGERWFCSEAEARQEGWRAAR